MELLNQLGGLILGSLPTIVFFLILVVAYRFLVRRPLDKVLAERRARTTGAQDEAQRAMGAAEAETRAFEDKMRAAKREIFEMRERKLREWAANRDRALEQARQATAEKIKAAKSELDRGSATARGQIEGLSHELSAQILRAVLPAGTEATL